MKKVTTALRFAYKSLLAGLKMAVSCPFPHACVSFARHAARFSLHAVQRDISAFPWQKIATLLAENRKLPRGCRKMAGGCKNGNACIAYLKAGYMAFGYTSHSVRPAVGFMAGYLISCLRHFSLPLISPRGKVVMGGKLLRKK